MFEGTVSRRGALKTGVGAMAALAVAPAPRALVSSGRQAASKPAQLRLLYATVEADVAAIKLVIPAFQRDMGITLHLDTMPYNALQQKVFAELASSSPYYDIVIVDTPWMPALTHKIQPLTKYILNKRLRQLNARRPGLHRQGVPTIPRSTIPRSPICTSPPRRRSTPQRSTRRLRDLWPAHPGQRPHHVLSQGPVRRSGSTRPPSRPSTAGRSGVPTTWNEFTQVAQFFTRPSQRLWGTTLMPATATGRPTISSPCWPRGAATATWSTTSSSRLQFGGRRRRAGLLRRPDQQV